MPLQTTKLIDRPFGVFLTRVLLRQSRENVFFSLINNSITFPHMTDRPTSSVSWRDTDWQPTFPHAATTSISIVLDRQRGEFKDHWRTYKSINAPFTSATDANYDVGNA